jgi:hypothetical protein
MPFVSNIEYISLYFFVLFRSEYWDPHELLDDTHKLNIDPASV